MAERTIAAIATPSGEGALGVIRISGEEAITIADKVFCSISGKKLGELEGYKAAYGTIRDSDTIIDDAVALVYRAPHSYTGEDTVEITVHGGSLLLRSVMRLILSKGAYPAAAGEFTKRAFLNGKIDLTGAESIMGLISAANAAELKLSQGAHNGKIREKISEIEADLTFADASIAAYSDYPDEDIEGLDPENFKNMLVSAKKGIEEMLSTYDAGRVLREGIRTAIVGKPNVGKSTLMNILNGYDRSIVTEVAGTTRDVIESTVTIGDITLHLSDTAGIHETEDEVESIGVERAVERIKASQLILAVFDPSRPLDKDDIEILEQLDKNNSIVIINKIDLGDFADEALFEGFRKVRLSAKIKQGYKELAAEIADIAGTANLKEDSVVLINERQRACAARALDGVSEALNALISGATMDAVGVCVDDALAALLELNGKRVTNEVTDEIFKRFCVGK